MIPAYSGILAGYRALSNNIFLTVLGQSNAIASGTQAQTPPANPSNTFIWVPGTSSYAPYQAAVNSDPKGELGNAWGAELEFVAQLRAAGNTNPVYIHKWASGGKALNVGWKPTTGTDWNTWRTQRAAAIPALPSGNWAEVVMWCQGEADSTSTNAPNYAANYNNLISLHRSGDALGAAAIWITERIRPYTGDDLNFVYAVRAAQETALAGVRVIDLDFDPANFGSLHPGVSWVTSRGQRAYNAYANNVTIGDITPTNLGSITDVTGSGLGTIVTANEITIAGIDRSAVVTISGGEYRVRNSNDTVFQDWTSAAGVIHPFQKLTLRGVSSTSFSTPVTVTVTIGGVSESWSITTVNNNLAISGTPPASATVGQAYVFNATVTGGVAPYTFSILSGTLPFGLAITSTGFGGTPTTGQTVSGLVLRVTDSTGATADLGPFSITVTAAATLTTWDATVNNPTGLPNTVYTNDNRTASTSANTTAIRTVRNPVAAGRATGKWYARATVAGAILAGRSLGFVVQAVPPGTGTVGTNRWSWGGTTLQSNSSARTMPVNITTVNGDYEIAIDLDNNLFWMRQAGVGALWNNSATANPETGVDGMSCSARGSAAVFLMASLPNTTTACSWTIVSGTPPAGYTQWV